MRLLKFNHVFFLLMTAAAAGAFLIPAKFMDRVTPQVQALFWPVARPARALGAWAVGRGGTELPPEHRSTLAIRTENLQLSDENIKLRYDLEELRKINGEREKLGDLRPLCTPVPVVGGDAGTRESLAVASSSLAGLKDGMYVLSPGVTGVQIVGTLQRSGMAGGQVKLITNPGSRVYAYFSGLRKLDPAAGKETGQKPEAGYVRLNKGRVLVEGIGKQRMVVQRVTAADAKAWGVQAGDYVVLDDEDWPPRLRGRRIGRVAEIVPHKEQPLFVEIRINPLCDLLALREVMVLTREK
jgi:hypothetical protein